jgi:hypothetical protein
MNCEDKRSHRPSNRPFSKVCEVFWWEYHIFDHWILIIKPLTQWPVLPKPLKGRLSEKMGVQGLCRAVGMVPKHLISADRRNLHTNVGELVVGMEAQGLRLIYNTFRRIVSENQARCLCFSLHLHKKILRTEEDINLVASKMVDMMYYSISRFKFVIGRFYMKVDGPASLHRKDQTSKAFDKGDHANAIYVPDCIMKCVFELLGNPKYGDKVFPMWAPGEGEALPLYLLKINLVDAVVHSKNTELH